MAGCILDFPLQTLLLQVSTCFRKCTYSLKEERRNQITRLTSSGAVLNPHATDRSKELKFSTEVKISAIELNLRDFIMRKA